MTTEELKLNLIELCGSLETAKEAFAWVSEPSEPVVPEPVPVEGGIILTDDEVLKLDAAGLKEAAMLRLAVKQNAGMAEVKA